MEKLLEFSDITLIPKDVNNGWSNRKVNYFVDSSNYEVGLGTKSLPIFTSPMEAVVGVDNWKTWQDNGIRPILPRTVDIRTRLDACKYIFSAFSFQEVFDNFLMRDLRGSNSQYYVCIDSGNGHDIKLLDLSIKIKKMYGNQIILMGGNIGNPQTYSIYCSGNSGFDYVRVGMSSGSLVDREKYGFHYPMASLLGAISSIKKSNKNINNVKVIADGGIKCHSDILKAIALGADYVMIGCEFSKLVESSGTIYRRIIKPDPEVSTIEEVQNPSSLSSLSSIELSDLDLVRQYFGNTTLEMQALRDGYNDVSLWKKEKNPKIKVNDSEWIWVSVNNTLHEWLSDFKECINYGFMMSNSSNWKEFQDNVICGRVK